MPVGVSTLHNHWLESLYIELGPYSAPTQCLGLITFSIDSLALMSTQPRTKTTESVPWTLQLTPFPMKYTATLLYLQIGFAKAIDILITSEV